MFQMRQGNYLIGLMDLCNYVLERIKPTVMVEVGSYAGESTCIFSGLFKCKVHAVDFWTNGYDSNDYASYLTPMSEVERIFDLNTKGKDIIKHKTTSIEASKDFEDKSLDLVYIDACHKYSDVLDDLMAWYPKVKPGGFIAGHDYSCKDVQNAIKDYGIEVEKIFIDDSWLMGVL